VSTITTDNLHPEDVLFFAEVAAAMRRVASNYELPLRSISPLPDAHLDLDTDRWGDGDSMGNIRLMLRPKVVLTAPGVEPRGSRINPGSDLLWADAPLSPAVIWENAAHELAHLRHLDHSQAHYDLSMELEQALTNQRPDHRDKVLKKLVKMQAQRDSEAKLGNSAAAEAFASAINRMLIEYELNPTDIDYARTADNDPVIEVLVDLDKYGQDLVAKVRVAWQESLARVCATSHLCRYLVRKSSNSIWFVGTKSRALVAEYAYGTLVAAATDLSAKARHDYWAERGWRKAEPHERGYREAWLSSFVSRISQRFDEARAEVLAAHTASHADAPGSTSTAVLRLNTALVKVQEYMDGKFTSKRRVKSAVGRYTHNSDGHRDGRAAADRMNIGGKAIASGVTKGLLS